MKIVWAEIAGSVVKSIASWMADRKKKRIATKEAGDAEVRDWLGRKK